MQDSQTRHKSIDEQLESSKVESLGIDEQLEINISGRKFSISLKGFEPNAIVEIKELLETSNVDLLDLMRAYLNSVHSRCELESQVAHIAQKIDQKLPQVFITDETLDEQADNEVDNELDEEDLAEYSEDLEDDFGGFEEEFGHSGEVYGAFGEFSMLGGLGIHSKSEIEPSEEELDEIMAQKEQEAQNQKVQDEEDKEYEATEASEALEARETTRPTQTQKEQDEQIKQVPSHTQAQQTQKKHITPKSSHETIQNKNPTQNHPQNNLAKSQTMQNQENHSQNITNQLSQPPKAKFDQARFDFADYSPLHDRENTQSLKSSQDFGLDLSYGTDLLDFHNLPKSNSKSTPKKEAQNLVEVESKANYLKASHSKAQSNDLQENLDFHTESNADLEADLQAKSKADSKGHFIEDSKDSESHTKQADSTFANRANNSFDFMADSLAPEPKPKSPLSRITKFFKNP